MSSNAVSIRTRLMLAGVLGVALLILLGGIGIYGQRSAAAAFVEARDGAVRPLLTVGEIDSALKEVRFRIAGVALDAMSTIGARSHLKETRERLPGLWRDFLAGVRLNDLGQQQRQQIDEIGKQLDALGPLFDELDGAYAKDNREAAAVVLRDKWPLVHKNLIKPLSELIPAQVEAMNATFQQAEHRGQQLNMIAVVANVIGIGILALVMVQLIGALAGGIGNMRGVLAKVAEGDLGAEPDTRRGDELGEMARSLQATLHALRDIISGVQGASGTITSAADRLKSELQDVIGRGHARQEFMQRAAAGIEQTTASAQDVAASSAQVADASAESRSIAANGNARMDASIAAIRRVEQAVEESARVMADLSAATEHIQAITQVIREIADQTNLLALNAAIEAARAGEQGRGFAVVADEVRKLAERTSSSTTDIATTVEAIRQKAATAVQAMHTVHEEVVESVRYSGETRDTLAAIVASAERVSDLAGGIAAATRSQLEASQRAASEMEQVSAMSADNSESIDRLGGVTDEVAQLAHQLQGVIGRFRV